MISSFRRNIISDSPETQRKSRYEAPDRDESQLGEDEWPPTPEEKWGKRDDRGRLVGGGGGSKMVKLKLTEDDQELVIPPGTQQTKNFTNLKVLPSDQSNSNSAKTKPLQLNVPLSPRSNNIPAPAPASKPKLSFKRPGTVTTTANSNNPPLHSVKKAPPLTSSRLSVPPVSKSTSVSSSFKPPSSIPVEPKKRTLPWESLDVSRKKAKLTQDPTTGAFRSLTVPGLSELEKNAKPNLLSNAEFTIKQKLILSPEQLDVLDRVRKGENVFFTGSAGTGKSLLLREIIKNLKEKFDKKKRFDAVVVTASTGMAACNIGGITIHSFSGIGLGELDKEGLLKRVRKNKKAVSRWMRTEVLILDEVSMLEGPLFDKLEYVASEIRKKQNKPVGVDNWGKPILKPFGGIQLIITGDFFQLPPVTRNSTPVFTFEAEKWEECIGKNTINLTQVFRQKDSDFISMLNELRYGKLSPESTKRFISLSRDPKYTDDLAPTELYPRREDVDRSNSQRLQSLSGELRIFKSEDTAVSDQDGKNLDSATLAVKELHLKVGAQVMLVKNLNEDLVNGSIGRVVGFGVDSAWEWSDDESEGIKAPKMKSEEKKKKDFEGEPFVEFRVPGKGLVRHLVKREEFKIEDSDGKTVRAKRKQFPLVLAWAMSIHKSQGQTLERVKVDLGKVFEKGQSYVALSRATSLEGLQVLRFDARKVLAHPKVVEWTKRMAAMQNTGSGSGTA